MSVSGEGSMWLWGREAGREKEEERKRERDRERDENKNGGLRE